MEDWRLTLSNARQTLVLAVSKPGFFQSVFFKPGFVLCVLLLAALLSSDVVAKRIYQFTDENGIVHVTDVPPDTDQPVSSRPIKVDPKSPIVVHKSKTSPRFPERFENKLYGPVEVEVKFTENDNIISTPSLPRRFVLAPRFNDKLISLKPERENRGYKMQISYRTVPGDPKASHDANAVYIPPFAPGAQFFVSQGFHGKATHNTPGAKYAIDIPMPEGTPVMAARDGVVMDVQDDFYEGGDDLKRFGQRANRVVILHADGTMAIYAHLAPESAAIRPGKVVLAGEMIGRSGNTGYSTGPHLHFAIQKNAGMKIVSLPFRFRNEAGQKLTPKKGDLLTGYEYFP